MRGDANGAGPLSPVGLVPAAGRGERLQPLSGSKEVLEIAGRPVMDYVVERMRAAQPSEIRVVTRPDKDDVVDRARHLGARVIVGTPGSLSESLLLGLAGLDSRRTVLIGLPDSLWQPEDGFAKLVAQLTDGADVVLGLFRSREPERCDVVTVDSEGRVLSVEPKPQAPRSHLVWGCLAARAGALAGLSGHDEPGDLFDLLARSGRVRGVDLGTEFVDIGTKDALRRARETLSTQ
ncbi:MAG: NTP transferase domain-containing protein [Thermoleophilia bacterium]|nr:NTP transferase domain-containing protein [Thermoleophilia bacterium]